MKRDKFKLGYENVDNKLICQNVWAWEEASKIKLIYFQNTTYVGESVSSGLKRLWLTIFSFKYLFLSQNRISTTKNTYSVKDKIV